MKAKALIKLVVADAKAHKKNIIRLYFFSPSFRLLLNHRLGKFCYEHKFKVLRLLSNYYMYKQVTKRSCQISYKSLISPNVTFAHPIGIVIGQGVIIRENVRIWQHVTLGSHGKEGQKSGYPEISSGVKIYAGAKIFGSVVIGPNAVIGANAVVNIDVPTRGVAVGIPAKVINRL